MVSTPRTRRGSSRFALNRKNLRKRKSFNERVEKIEAASLSENVQQPECKTYHYFSDGVYTREIFMQAGAMVIGHEHLTRHMNIILAGRARVMCGDDVIKVVKAGDVFESDVGVRKVLFIDEAMHWITTHRTDKTTVEEVEDEIFKKSKTFLDFCGGIKAMNATELREKQKLLKQKETECLV